MRYKSYFSHLSDDADSYEEIRILLGMGYTIGEIEKKLGVSSTLVVQVLDDFAKGRIGNMIFESRMERLDERTQ